MIPHEEEAATFAPVLCSNSYWLFTDIGGVLEVLAEINTWVRKGQVIARVSNIFGDRIRTYYAPEDGIVIGKNANPVNQTGDRILHLGVVSHQFAKVSNDGR
jgi:predicted deacylase